MSRLSRIVRDSDPGERLKKLTENIPEYNIDKNSLRQKMSGGRKFLIGLLIVILAIIVFIYIPGFLMNDSEEEESYNIVTDTNATARVAQILRDNPNEDFDDDGLDNVSETNLGSNAWYVDTDGDGATDYYEARVSDTDPLVYDLDTLENLVKKDDEEAGNEVQSPYKIGNVVLWADNYESKTAGAVIESLSGYRFSNFTGYAEFQDGSLYAYKVSEGKHELLPYDSTNEVWRIDGSCDVETYTEPLKEVVDISVFGNHFYPDATGGAAFLERILPDKGFITAEEKTLMDVEPDTSSDPIVITPVSINYDADDDARFMENTDSLSQLLGVLEEIDNGKCVAVSLFSEELGEYVGIIYGYDLNGNLYVADPETLEGVGMIRVVESAMRSIGEDKKLVLRTCFLFKGLGFSSSNRDHINFFAVSGAGSNTNGLLNELEQEAIDSANHNTEEESDASVSDAGDNNNTATETSENAAADITNENEINAIDTETQEIDAQAQQQTTASQQTQTGQQEAGSISSSTAGTNDTAASQQGGTAGGQTAAGTTESVDDIIE